MNDLSVENLRCNYWLQSLGIDITEPELSWELRASRRGARQTAYRVIATDADADATLWDTGRVESDRSAHVAYAGAPLASRQRVTWRVRVWDERGESAESAPAGWEMGLLARDDWGEAEWIGGPLRGGPRTTSPSPYLRCAFQLDGPVARARLYVTALGVYECRINGRTAGDDVLMPGWTDFKTRVRYQVYDVADQLQAGENVIGAIVGDGWACSHLAWAPRQIYFDRPRFLARLEATLADGSTRVVVSDGAWRVAYGPILESDLLMGESYDARMELSGWDRPGYDDGPAAFPTAGWLPVQRFPDPGAALVATNGPAIRRIQELSPVADPREIGNWPSSRWICDFGQNLIGRVRLRVSGPAGATITLRHAEVLDPDGGIYTDNLRSAKQTDHYTLRGEGEEVWEPRFTFHGFRYVEVSGYPGTLAREALTAVVLHSDVAPTGEFACSDPLLNQLQHNIVWGQKGNFLDVPTDCPQRDERLGWTGDAQVFARTAAFNMDVAGFLAKYVQDMADAQMPDGAIPPVAPFPGALMPDGGPAWSDAMVIIPWTVYLCYGDTRLLAKHYETMARFIEYLRANSPGFIRCHPDWEGWHGFGDWLALDGSGKTDGGTPKDLIGTAYFAYVAQLMAKIAAVLDREEDAARYAALFEDVRSAFQRRFVTHDGLLTAGTQTAHVLALRFNLLPEAQRSGALEAIVRDIRARDGHLSTGFVGASHLPFVLSDNGRLDVAYDLLNQKTWPSWLYAVTQGATTIWERWDGWTAEKGFQDPGMNSFNHYAYGAIGEWLYAVTAGIDVDPEQPGYRHVIFCPRPGGGLTHARAALHTLYGPVESAWRLEGGRFTWEAAVPPNATATAHLPADTGAAITEGGVPAETAEGVTLLRRDVHEAVYRLASGRYQFTVNAPSKSRRKKSAKA